MNKISARKIAFYAGLFYLAFQFATYYSFKYLKDNSDIQMIASIGRVIFYMMFIGSFYKISIELKKYKLKYASIVLTVVIFVSFAMSIILQLYFENENAMYIQIGLPSLIFGIAVLYFGSILIIEKEIYGKSTKYTSIFLILQGVFNISWYLLFLNMIMIWVANISLIKLVYEKKEKYGINLR